MPKNHGHLTELYVFKGSPSVREETFQVKDCKFVPQIPVNSSQLHPYDIPECARA